jgi:hypothetical protein
MSFAEHEKKTDNHAQINFSNMFDINSDLFLKSTYNVNQSTLNYLNEIELVENYNKDTSPYWEEATEFTWKLNGIDMKFTEL